MLLLMTLGNLGYFIPAASTCSKDLVIKFSAGAPNERTFSKAARAPDLQGKKRGKKKCEQSTWKICYRGHRSTNLTNYVSSRDRKLRDTLILRCPNYSLRLQSFQWI